MEKKNYPCADCVMRKRYENNPKSLIARFWHWHTRFCPGWKGYFNTLTEEEKAAMRERYNLKK